MAGTLKLNLGINYTSNEGLAVRNTKAISVDITGEGFVHGIQLIGTTEEEIAQLAEIGTPGYLYIYNLGSTFIEVGVTTGVYSVKIGTEEFALFRVDGSTIYAKADTSPNTIEYILIED